MYVLGRLRGRPAGGGGGGAAGANRLVVFVLVHPKLLLEEGESRRRTSWSGVAEGSRARVRSGGVV